MKIPASLIAVALRASRPPALLLAAALLASPAPAARAVGEPALRAAAIEFGITPESGGPTVGKTGARVLRVAGPLKSTVTLLEDGAERVCVVSTHFNSPKAANVSALFRRTLASYLGLPVSNVLLFVSHNHSDLKVAENQVEAYETLALPPGEVPGPRLLPVGRELLDRMGDAARRLPALLRPVTVWWAEGSEGRLTYNRKGRRADGSTYLMREEDRDLMGADFNGDIDRQAPVVLLRDAGGAVVVAIAQFTGHPCSCYHPERPVIFGDWPQVACDHLAAHLSRGAPVPVSFLQGCAGDVNSKGMFRGDVELSRRYGRMLADSYIAALGGARPSVRDGLDYAVEKVAIPLAPLPSRGALEAEIGEMEEFVHRAGAGDENTLSCVGLNFPRELTPAYRGKLIEGVLPWSRWALERHLREETGAVARALEVDLFVLRLGDVGIVGMPFEPFQGIGRQMRAGAALPLTIPCGYTNVSHGYLTDGPNTGDREYMSAHHRYTRFRAPWARPAGDVLAARAIAVLRRFAD